MAAETIKVLKISDRILSKNGKIMPSAVAIQNEAHEAILDAIKRRRDQGAARAVQIVARIFGFSERRVISYSRNEVRNPPAWEYLTIKEKREEELRLWLADRDAQAAILRTRLEEWNA